MDLILVIFKFFVEGGLGWVGFGLCIRGLFVVFKFGGNFVCFIDVYLRDFIVL